MNKSIYLSYCAGFLGYVAAQNLIVCNVLSHLGITGCSGGGGGVILKEESQIPPKPFSHPGSGGWTGQTKNAIQCFGSFY